MTKEEASDILDDYDVNFEGHTKEEVAEAFDVAFKALEQEPILNKVRDEIEQKIKKRPGLNHTRAERDRNDAFLEVLDIIDKYREESEEV